MAQVPVQPADRRTTDQQTIYTAPDQREDLSREPRREEKVTVETLTGGASLEVIGGAVAVVLSIIGLAGNWVLYMAGISTIAVGAALLAYGGAVAARWNETVRAMPGGEDEIAGGVGTEILAGVAGIVLGILALAKVLPLTLLPIAAIVFGGALLVGGAMQPQLASVHPEREARARRVVYQSMKATGGIEVLTGAASVVLGILALINIGPPLTLSLVAMLVVGAGALIAGAVSAAKFGRVLRHVPA